MTPLPTAPCSEPHLARARQLVEEGRDPEAAALLEAHPSPAACALHRSISTRAATAALQVKEIAAATAWLDRGLAGNPADATLNFFRGNLYFDSGHAAAAVTCFRHSVAAEPRRPEFVVNLALALLTTGAPAAAAALLESFPDSAIAQLNLGHARESLGEAAAAAEAYERAGRLQPDLFEAWFNLGCVRAHDAASALVAFTRAVAVRPTAAHAHLERGRMLARLQSLPEAATSFERTCRLDPTLAQARLELAHTRQRLCDWRGHERLGEEVVAPALAAAARGQSIDPFLLLALPGSATPAELLAGASARSARLAAAAHPLRAAAAIPPARPLRIGYVSPDFGNHAVGNCLRSLLARHDRTKVSIHAFSLFAHPDNDYRTALRAGADTWDELAPLPARAAAERIGERGIDVLIDLAGHTQNSGLPLFAWRPAPVQLTWLGYPGTTGATYIDALLADAHIIPPGEESVFTEQLIRLPGCYLPSDDTQTIATGGDSRAEHGLPESGTVFCAFNNTYKIEPLIFGAWMDILRRRPGSVLWLRQCPAPAQANLRREAAARGAAQEQLVFEDSALPKDRHLARHRAADLYLDTHFYNAHSTAADALRAGLPVLTFPGQSFPSRVGASLLAALGLTDELVATSAEDYVQRAVRFASEPDRLRAVKQKLALASVQPGGPFDTAAFARKLEAAYARLCCRQA
jgi:predicted O-linked N-acetylglucosamine transferase (SPINDLY family)